jgi:hypothetical protein
MEITFKATKRQLFWILWTIASFILAITTASVDFAQSLTNIVMFFALVFASLEVVGFLPLLGELLARLQ